MMMMSMFSSFDALTAESYGWISPAPSTFTFSTSTVVGGKIKEDMVHHITKPEAAAVMADLKGPSSVKEVLVRKFSAPSQSKDKLKNGGGVRRQKDARMRFPVELDGIHPFETILPY